MGNHSTADAATLWQQSPQNLRIKKKSTFTNTSAELHIKMQSPLTIQKSTSDDFSNHPPVAWPDPQLQPGGALFWSRYCRPEVRGSTPWVRKSFQLSWPGRTSWPLPHSAPQENKVASLHASERGDRAMACFRKCPVITNLCLHLPWSWDTSRVMHIWNQQQIGMQNVILEALRLNFLFYVKFTSHRTTAVYFLYTSCNFHAHLMRILGSKISYENCEDWRLLFLFGHQACM